MATDQITIQVTENKVINVADVKGSLKITDCLLYTSRCV